ncbi:tyrosine-type recombinase/integrase [Moraxella bovis]|uniref:tyrosine-type recombinase/integrase n=1 Tax=Moraxella bovis TaxID=476 RepID=UPI0022274D48|nr:site-specific integrase [Moraxella bovis]UYZ81091.1 site-specific integrase [Moraxella bovis]
MNFEKLSDIIKYYQEYHLTKYKYTYRLALLAPFDDYPLSTLKRADVKKWALERQKQVSNATVNKEIGFCRSAINLVSKDFEITLNNPFANVKYVEADTIPNYLSPQEYEKLLTASLEFDNTDLHDFITLLVMTGCRQSEVLTLKWANVHLEKRQFIVRNTLNKSRRTMYKYLNDTAYNVLKHRQANKQGDYVFTNPKTGENIKSFNKGWQLCKKRAGINCRMHDLRHTYASWLVQKGVPIYTVKELLGHGDIASTQRYAHLDYSTKLQAVDLIG